MEAKPCQRTKGHTGPHACEYPTALYDVLTWETSLHGRNVWRKLQRRELVRGEALPEPEPHCLTAPPEHVS